MRATVRIAGIACAASVALGVANAQKPVESVDEARVAIATGRYAEGIGYLEKLPKGDSLWVTAQAHLARANALLSKFDEAERVARSAVAAPGGREALTALGDVLRGRGKLAAADSAYLRAVAEHATDSLSATLALALDDEGRGDRAKAAAAFDKFIDVYNNGADRLTSREMMDVAIAVRELGSGNPALFKDALRAFDRAIGLDPANIDARVMLGELFLAKYNGAEAQKTLDEARQVNASHPGALVAAAKRLEFDGRPGADSLLKFALSISPEFVPARVMIARGLLDVEDYSGAVREAERVLRTDQSNTGALAVIAAAKFLSGDEKGFADARARAAALNPHDGEFFRTLGEASGHVRRYDVAADFARQAIAADSSNWEARSLLGMNLLRLGKIADGKAALDAAFKGDPSNVWVFNTLNLLDTYKNYDITSSAHVNFMVEKAESALMSVYLTDIAERAYARFQQRYSYTPPPPIRIEVYRSHADFSVRTVGLAGIGALGVSFGTTLAFDSPAAKDAGPFNWASTVWHELAHTFTLGTTDHRIPRWFSEGLSVWEEHNALPGWGAKVGPKFLDAFRQGKLVPPSRMNDGFMHPAYPEQVMFSYDEAALICDLLVRDWGEKSIAALLAEYKAGRTTDEAFQKVVGMDMKAFDKRFDAYVRDRFAKPLAALADPGPEYPAGMTAEELGDMAAKSPGSLRAQMVAATSLARAQKPEAAIAAFERAHALFPEWGDEGSPPEDLAKLYLAKHDTARTIAMLKVRALGDESAHDANIELATLSLLRGDTATAIDAIERAIWINPFPPAIHQQLAALAEARGDRTKQVREREAVVALDPVDKAEALYQLARAYRMAGDNARAKRAVLRALEDAPNFERAQELLLSIVDGRMP